MKFGRKLKSPTPHVENPWLIVGLGNPGPEYRRTRHNVGFDVVEAIGEKHRIKLSVRKHRGLYGIGFVQDTGVILLKPMTFMNLSGQCVTQVARAFSVPIERILVISDDIDMELAKPRMRLEGSAGGHNGHKSLISSLGTSAYARIKIGVGRDDNVVGHVLSGFRPEDRVSIDRAIQRIVEAIPILFERGAAPAIEYINGFAP